MSEVAQQENLTITVKVVGVGVNETVTVESGSPLADALAAAKQDAAGELRVAVNGEKVEDPANFTPKNGDTIIVTPPDVKLG